MTASLAGTVAVVTGASRGIGAATSQALTAAGARVARLARSLADRSAPDRLDLRCDVTDERQVAAAADRIRTELGPVGLVVNNAGAFLVASLAETTREGLETQVAVNLMAPFLVARAFLPQMAEAAGGRHVLVGSVADHRAFAGNAAYAASKYGARGLHEVLRAEFGPRGVRCTLVSPGPTDTRLWDPVDPDHRPGFTPRDAMLSPDDVAQAILFAVTRPAHVDIDWLRIGPA